MMIPKHNRPAHDPRNGPVLLRQHLLTQGTPDEAIARMLRRKQLVRVRPGAFADPLIWNSLDDVGHHGLRCRAVLGQAKAPLVLSHVSGLPEYDAPVWGFPLNRVHATRTDGLSGRRGTDVQVHSGLLHAGDLAYLNGVPVMNPARLAFETLSHQNSEATFCVMNDLLHRKLVTYTDLNAQFVTMQTWPWMLAAEVLLRLADHRIESVGESRTLWCCYQHRLPMPVPQYKIRDSQGRIVARVDFAWPEFGVFLEFDGRIKYEKLLKPGQRASDVVVAEKRREELVCQLTGWRCIRITWADLADPARLAALILSYLYPLPA